MVARVLATPAALELIDVLRGRYGEVMFHQSGGCCDGSSPMCYPRGEFQVGDQDVLLGELGGQPFYIGAAQYEYWKHTQLIIDVVDGRGGMFSLEGPLGRRFLTRSRLFDAAERMELGLPEPDRPTYACVSTATSWTRSVSEAGPECSGRAASASRAEPP